MPDFPVPLDPRSLLGSARAAGARAVASGRWLANALIDAAPRIPVRDLAALREHHGGLEGQALADDLIRTAARASAAIGAASGAAIAIEQFAPPTWIAVPFELGVETLAIAAIELKLIAELHEVFGVPVRGTASERTVALVRAWAERRGVSAVTLGRQGGLADALGKGTREQLVRILRRRLAARLGRNLSSLAPLFAGAVAGAELNRRATRAVGAAVAASLASPGATVP